MMRKCLAPREQLVLSRASDVVRIAFDEFDGSRPIFDLEHPESPDVWTALLIAKTTGHWYFGAMLFEELEMLRLKRPTHFGHDPAIFKQDDEAHATVAPKAPSDQVNRRRRGARGHRRTASG